jgi:DNA-binding NtrC family response regulator
VRLLAATNRDLGKMVAEGKFREDLYFRLHVVPLTMPPLRDRKVDIPLLAGSFLKESAMENGKPFRELAPEGMSALLDYDWPGNVRELRTAVEHGVVMSNSQKILLRDLPASVRAAKEPGAATACGLNLQETERALIVRAIDDCLGNRTNAALMLGISRRTLQRRLKELNISKRPSQ